MSELNIPEIDQTAATVVGDYIVFVEAGYETAPEDPTTDFDGVGRIYSFSSRFRNYDRPAIEAALKNPNHVLLSYFEHGQCRWDVAGGGIERTPDFEWDGSANAGVWVPDHSIVESAKMLGMKPKTKQYKEWMVKQAESACEQYTDYCNGQVYYYDVRAFSILRAPDGAIFDLISDYRHSTPIYEDSSGGIFGYSDFQTEIKEVAKIALENLEALTKGPSEAL